MRNESMGLYHYVNLYISTIIFLQWNLLYLNDEKTRKIFIEFQTSDSISKNGVPLLRSMCVNKWKFLSGNYLYACNTWKVLAF